MVAVAVVLLLLGIVQNELTLVSPRVFAVMYAVVLAWAIWRARTEWRSRRETMTAIGLFVASVVVLLPPLVLQTDTSVTDRFAAAATGVMAVWILVMVALPTLSKSAPDADQERSSGDLPSWHVPALLATAFLLLTAVHWYLRGDFVAQFDETLYVLQSRLMREPGFVREIDPSLSQFFILRQSVFDAGRLYTQFPPGNPTLLAAFDALGLRWWAGTVTATIGVWFTYLLGRDLVSEFAGRIAAVLLATNVYVLVYAPGYMAHGPGLAMGTAAAWLAVRGTGTSGTQRVVRWTFAGLLLGALCAVRPLTGASLTLSLVIWQVVRLDYRWRDVVRLAACFALGSVLPLAALLAYNDITNGSPLTLGYSAAHGTLHDLGFGERGFVAPDSNGEWTTESSGFTPRRAIAQFAFVTSNLATLLSPVSFLIAPLVLIGLRYRLVIPYAAVAAFLVLPAVHFFYFYSHPRFQLELFPFLLVAVAALVARLRVVNRSLARSVSVAMVAGFLLVSAIGIPRVTLEDRPAADLVSTVREVKAARARLLVFVGGDEYALSYLSWLNVEDFPGQVIVARDLGGMNAELMRRFPGHTPFRFGESRRLEPLNKGP